MKMNRFVALCSMLFLLSLPVLGAVPVPSTGEVPETPTVEEPGAETELPFDIALTAVLTTLATWLVRRYYDAEKIQNNPAILAWVSVVAAALAGVLSEAMLNPEFSIASAGGSILWGWLGAQGLRRGKKLVGVK